MEFNRYNFSAEQQNSMRKETDLVMKYQQQVHIFLYRFLESTQDEDIPEIFGSFLHLLVKIYFNLESTLHLLPGIKVDVRQKISINLLYRSVVDDVINLYYLLGTVTRNSRKQESLRNEINILHKEFLMSCEEIIRAEARVGDYGYKLQHIENPSPLDTEQTLKDIHNQNPEIYDFKKNKYRPNKEIRSTSHSDLKPDLKSTDHVGFLSENQKVKFIAARKFSRSEIFTYLFKYFSQYQHYSPKAHELNHSDTLLDLRCYRWTLLEVINSIGEINRILELRDAARTDEELKDLINELIRWH